MLGILVSGLCNLLLTPLLAADDTAVLAPDRVVSWCIVPFDAKQRTPAQRAAMLQELGITRSAYDWRAQHVTEFEQEILEYQKHGIQFFAFWGAHDEAFKLFEKYQLHPQIWQMLGEVTGDTQQPKVEAAAQTLLPLARRTAALGCALGIYNHGGWGGEPQNMVQVCQRLHELGQDHVGIVYNFHHAHTHINDWASSLALMKPHLLCLNLNGMNPNEQPKILGIGKGDHELEMIRVVIESGYDGPIGILDHRADLDARESLIENRDGLAWIRKELASPGSGGPLPPTPTAGTKPKLPDDARSGIVVPGSEAYRRPPITVEVRATIHRRDRYNILVANDSKQSSDHWELFSMTGNGRLTAYLPGAAPDHVHSDAMICDGHPHTIAMIYEQNRIRLYVDGKQVADQAVVATNRLAKVPGDLGIGRLVEGRFRCDGDIHWLRIFKGVREIANVPAVDVTDDASTIQLWKFDLGDAAQPGMPTTEPSADDAESEPRNSQTQLPYDPSRVAQLVRRAQQSGDATRGARVFVDEKLACLSCHKIGSKGGTIGPALTTIAKDRTLNQIVESILWPQRQVSPEHITWKILTTDGNIVTGFKHSSDDQAVVIRDTATNNLVTVVTDDIEQEMAGGSVMPDGLTAAMSPEQQLDLIRFMSELGRDGEPLSESIQQVIQRAQMHGHSHGPADFPLSNPPLRPANWQHATHTVNRDRAYDFYTKQAEYFRQQPHPPTLINAFPGLDGGDQGHWGNQSEVDWADDRWNTTQLGSLQSGVFRADAITVPRGVCVRLGDDGEMSACFNPDTLAFDAVWTGGFVKFSSVREGFLGGLKPDGSLIPVPTPRNIDGPFQYHGYYRSGQRVIFSYTIDGVKYLDSAWVDDGKFVRDFAPADEHPLRDRTTGGPRQWPQVIETTITLGTQRPYAIDTIALPYDNPWNALVSCGGHDFLGDGSALVCTMQGDVWHVSGLDSGLVPQDSGSKNAGTENANQPGVARWTRFASGLHHALGLVVSDGQVYVQCRDQLTRLTDLNDDGEADFYECFSNAPITSSAGHDFICGLQRDRRGHFYTASGNQGLLRISPNGKTATVVATGFRNPDGLGILPDGTVTVPVSEGGWTPASAIHAVKHAASDSGDHPPHHGYGGPKNGQPPELPLVYLPRGIDNSSGGQVHVDSQSFGPLQDQLLHFSFGAGTWFSVLRDQVDGQIQGAVVPLAGDFLSGAHRGRFHPVDGQLYVCGMSGWGTYTPDDGCFQRVRYTGDVVQMPVAFHAFRNGIRITFAEPIDVATAADPAHHFAQCWNYRYSGAYGSPEYSSTHPGTAGHDPLRIESAKVLDDGRSLFLEIPELQPVNQLHLRMHVNDDEPVSSNPAGSGHDLFITLHKLDEPFTAFDGYQLRQKQIAVHPMLFDLATMTKRTPNRWHQPIANARKIQIETGSNLSYVTRQFTVRANEPLALTLSNPDVVPHNWVLVEPGAMQQVGQLGNQMIADPYAFARQYIPQTNQIIAHTDIVSAGQDETIYFVAPNQPGRYPFLCTFPGHWMVMNGTMIVTE
ncbi:Azurin precursor [Rubripirellula lacrimiformis]|uniref:Azurin n=2 Tax=Rubripirellula lacrimiformis TaxID=1930273 RepID=A0A517ND55_9BACT|nr:Azurin precursor [Rubripirellula lacrimiformis]